MSRLAMLLLALAIEMPQAEDADAPDWFAQLEALGRGDVTALARLRRLVTSQLMRMGAYGHRDAWDDLAQEVLVRVWRAHRDGRIRERRAVPVFVRTTARNAFIDWTRSRRRELDLPDEEVVARGDAADGEEPIDAGTELVLRAALERLEQRHRDVVRCLYLEGLSYDETARHLERPRGTINRLQREAIQALRAILLAGEASGAEEAS